MPLKENNTLNLIEVFASVQGETTFSGLPTTFVRLAACNLRCSWCDTTYSFGKGHPWSFDKIHSVIADKGCPYVCITGGEPLLQSNVYPFMQQLCDKGYTLSLETSGSLPIEKVDSRVHTILDIKCPGSGMESKNFWENMQFLRPQDEVKFVIKDRNDYIYAKNVCAKYELEKRHLHPLFSPVHGALPPEQLVKWIIEDRLAVRLNLQIHKFIWTPETRGV